MGVGTGRSCVDKEGTNTGEEIEFWIEGELRLKGSLVDQFPLCSIAQHNRSFTYGLGCTGVCWDGY